MDKFFKNFGSSMRFCRANPEINNKPARPRRDRARRSNCAKSRASKTGDVGSKMIRLTNRDSPNSIGLPAASRPRDVRPCTTFRRFGALGDNPKSFSTNITIRCPFTSCGSRVDTRLFLVDTFTRTVRAVVPSALRIKNTTCDTRPTSFLLRCAVAVIQPEPKFKCVWSSRSMS